MDNLTAAQTSSLTEWKHGDPLSGSADKLNEPVKALQALLRPSVSTGQSNGGIGIVNLPDSCRVLITSASQAKSGLGPFDGVTLNDKDLVLFATGATPGNDGIYRVHSGAWEQIAKLNPSQVGPGQVLPHGHKILIYDGTSHAGEEWYSGLSGAPTF